jgi:hypothetical protein
VGRVSRTRTVIIDPPLLVAMTEVQRDQVVSALARLFVDMLADCSTPERKPPSDCKLNWTTRRQTRDPCRPAYRNTLSPNRPPQSREVRSDDLANPGSDIRRVCHHRAAGVVAGLRSSRR